VFTKEDRQLVPDPEFEAVRKKMDPVRIERHANPQQDKETWKDCCAWSRRYDPGSTLKPRGIGHTPLGIISNKSMYTGCTPEDFRAVNVTQFTKDTEGDTGNYRPISLTSIQ
jgi:hypothetical protein